MISPVTPVPLAAAISSARRVSGGRPSRCSANACSSAAPTASGAASGAAPPSCAADSAADRLQQRERVAARPGHQLAPDVRVDRDARAREQRLRVVRPQPVQLQRLDPDPAQPLAVARRRTAAPRPRRRVGGRRTAAPRATARPTSARRRSPPAPGRRRAAVASRLSVAAATANRSSGAGGPSASAPESAARWRSGSAVEQVLERADEVGEPGEREVGLGLQRAHPQHRERSPRQLRATCSSRLVLPIPGLAVDDQRRAQSHPRPPEAVRRSVRLRRRARAAHRGDYVLRW